MYKQGDIILVPFPFTNLSENKVRPALVLSRKDTSDDYTVCFISSIVPKKILSTEILIKKESKNFKHTGLKVDSLIKVTKIATLEKSIFIGTLGYLTVVDFLKVKKVIKNYFGI